ncbi:putative metal-dependent hydrolase [Paenibacillus donghaensis]|uniref:YfiT family bacillithiol transferase n=1 Tax=Paenibacillus donghaensis TaxID=414771 RepID=UPI001883A1B5|nr:putative metal-dependent hydrolase [Paenibacillus donghaensis]MBE9916401.1 putative metal-dependent hydrolase [Paenibacillus donghaensis]
MSSDLRYPIGEFSPSQAISPAERSYWIDQLRAIPGQVRDAVSGLSEEQLDTPYRPDGWTVRQVVHHLADSHMNALLRVKLALTEDDPVIKPYEETLWAELPDSVSPAPEVSLKMLDGIHARMALLFKSLKEDDWHRSYVHPVNGKTQLDRHLGLYAWHGRHHLAHITSLVRRMDW